jgi:nitrogen PTS system EIIA component
MDIKAFLSRNDALLDVRASDKTGLLNELCARAGKALNRNPEPIATEILRREELGSTGLGGGIAIPHARIADLSAPFGVIARLRRPLDFDAIDGQPVDIVFLLLLPITPAGEQLNALAAVARKLRDADIVRELRAAQDSSTLYVAVTAAP